MKKNVNFIENICNGFGFRRYPISITHFITEKCNAKCPHCFVDKSKQLNELSLEQIEKIASTSGPCLQNIGLTGGEPFSRDDIFEIADIWYKNSTVNSIVIPTNGSMPHKIETFLKKANKINLPIYFFISYDFIGEKHSDYRGIKDLHIKLLEAYKIIKSYGDKFNATFQITLSDKNYSSAFETYKYIRDELKIKNVNCPIIRGENANKISPEVKSEMAQVYKMLQKQINADFDKQLLNEYKNTSLTKIVLNSKNKILWKYIIREFEENKYIFPCRAASLYGVISSDGNVYPCELLPNEFQNLRDYDYNFINCWKSQKFDNIRKKILCSKCHCTYECCSFLNIYSNPKYSFEILSAIIKNYLNSGRSE